MKNDKLFWGIQLLVFGTIGLACYYLWQDNPNNLPTKQQ